MKINEKEFLSKSIQRNIEICKTCKYFHVHNDNTYGCGNVLKGHGHPWCQESYYPLKEELFIRANIFINIKEECKQHEESCME